MIVHAIVRWETPVTIDIPIGATTTEAKDLVMHEAVSIIFIQLPKVVRCIEREDIVDENQ